MANKFWIVWCPSKGAPTQSHGSHLDAAAEAVRLANKHHGAHFYVLASEKEIWVEDPTPPLHVEMHY